MSNKTETNESAGIDRLAEALVDAARTMFDEAGVQLMVVRHGL